MLWGSVLSQIGITVIVILSNIQTVDASTSTPPNTTSSNSSSCSQLRLANEKCVQQVVNLEGMVLLITDERERYRNLVGTLQQERDYLADKAHRWQIAAEMAADQSGAMELELLELKHRLEAAQNKIASLRRKAKQDEETDLEKGNLVLSGMYRVAVRAQQTAEQSLQDTQQKLESTENKLKAMELDIQKEKDNTKHLQSKLDDKDKIIEKDRERLKSLEDILRKLPPTQTGAIVPHRKDLLGKEFILSSGRTVLLHQHPQASQLDVPLVPKLTEAVLHSNMFRIPSGFVPRRYPFCDVPTVTLQLTQIALAFTIGSVSMCFLYRSSLSRASIRSKPSNSNLSVEMTNTSTNTSPTKLPNQQANSKSIENQEPDNQEFAKALKILANIAENSLLKELGESSESMMDVSQNKLLSDPDLTFLCSLGEEDSEGEDIDTKAQNDIILSNYLDGLKEREKYLYDQIMLLSKQKEAMDEQFHLMRVNTRSLDKRAALLTKRELELNEREKTMSTTKSKNQKTDVKQKDLSEREETLKSKWKEYENAFKSFEEEKKKWTQKNRDLDEKVAELDTKTKTLMVRQEQIAKQEHALKEQQNKLKLLKEKEKQLTKRQSDVDALKKSLELEEEEMEKRKQELSNKERHLNNLQSSLLEEKKNVVLQEEKCEHAQNQINQNSELWSSYIEMIWRLVSEMDEKFKETLMDMLYQMNTIEPRSIDSENVDESDESDKDTEYTINPIIQTQRYINESWNLVFDFPDVGCQWTRWNSCTLGSVGDVLHFIPDDKKLSERIQLVLSTEELPEGASVLKYKEITINRLFESFPRNVLILDQYNTTVGSHHAFVIQFMQTSPSPMYTFSTLVVVSNMVFVWQLVGMASSPVLLINQQHKIDQLALPMIQSIQLGT